MRPIGRIGDICSCGAVFFLTQQTTVFSSGQLVLVGGSMQSHGGIGIPSPPYNTFAQGMPILRLGDISDVCRWVYPHHFSQPLTTGDLTVFDL